MNKKKVFYLSIPLLCIAIWVLLVKAVMPWKVEQLKKSITSSCQPVCQLTVDSTHYSLMTPLKIILEKIDFRGITPLGDLSVKIPSMEVAVLPMSLFGRIRFSDVLIKTLEIDFLEKPKSIETNIPKIFVLASKLSVQKGMLRYQNSQSQRQNIFDIVDISWGGTKAKKMGFLHADLKTNSGQEIQLKIKMPALISLMNSRVIEIDVKNPFSNPAAPEISQLIYKAQISQRFAKVQIQRNLIAATMTVFREKKNRKNPFHFQLKREENESIISLLLRTIEEINQLH